VGPRNAYGPVADNGEQPRPFSRGEPSQDSHDRLVNFVPVRLTKTNDEDAEVLDLPVLCESFVGGDQHSLFAHGQAPEIGIQQSLARCAPDIFHVVANLAEVGDGHARNILVNEDLHPSERELNRRDLLFC
jgi:hypothetical protein